MWLCVASLAQRLFFPDSTSMEGLSWRLRRNDLC